MNSDVPQDVVITDFLDVFSALRSEGDAFASAIRSATAEELSSPTNCPPWTLAELAVHTAGSIRIGDFPDADPDERLRAASDYYRRPERDTAEYREHNVRQTQAAAERVLAKMSAADCFADALESALDTAARIGMERIVQVNGVGPMRFDALLATRVVSVAAHGLDAAITLGRRPWTTPSALQQVCPILLDLLEAPLPSQLAWTDQRLLERATGRSTLTESERHHLGPLVHRLPVLS